VVSGFAPDEKLVSRCILSRDMRLERMLMSVTTDQTSRSLAQMRSKTDTVPTSQDMEAK
jgi:hypothetical protein